MEKKEWNDETPKKELAIPELENVSGGAAPSRPGYTKTVGLHGGKVFGKSVAVNPPLTAEPLIKSAAPGRVDKVLDYVPEE